MNDTDVQATNTDCKLIINLYFKSDWLITMLFQGQQRWNMLHSGSALSNGQKLKSFFNNK